MLNSAISSNATSISIGKQVATGSRSSLLTSRIEFTSSENECSLATQALQAKYNHFGGDEKTNKALENSVTFNGQMKGSNGMDHNKNSQGKHLIMNGNHELHLQGDGVPNPRISLYPQGKVHLEWKQIHKIGAGLANLGNTCFMNTVIQCLTYCPPLVNYLLHDDDHSKCKISGFCMMCELQKHIKRALDRPGDVIKPLYIYQKLKSIAKHFQFGRQEDAHEFLRYVVDNLWKASLFNYDGNIKLDPASKETTVINHIFGGYHRSQVICLRCKEKSNTYDHFMDFILDIKQNVQSLEKALEKFIQPELLQNENAYKCPRCNMKVSAQKRFTVHRPPNVATFQFKRFDYNRMFGGKITKHVSYPEKLDLRPYMSDTKGGPVIYRLNAVLVHLGPSCNSGHYFCYVRNSNGYWYLMDDARVHQVSVNQVLNQQAYVLFYIRVAATSSNHLKKSPSAVSTNHKISEGIKNGVLGHLPNDSSASSTSKSKSITKTTSSPAIIRVSSSSSSSLVNGNAYGVSPKLSLPQNREKVVFGIRRPEPGMKTLIDKTQLNHNVKYNSSVSNNSGHACLVPYAGDSSESSDDEHRKIKSKTSNYKNSAKNTHETSKSEATSTVNSDSCKNKIDLKEESKDNVGQKSEDCVATSNKHKITNENFVKKSSAYRTSSPSVTPSDSLQVTTKVKSTFPWHVSDASLHSPSVASGSSTNSVNSTADWTVTDQENINRNKIERTYTGWTITQNEKSSNEQIKTKGPSTHHKDTIKKSLSNSNNSECSELLNKSEVLVESSSNGNTSVLNDAEESPTKTKTNEDLQYCTNKSSSSKSSELFDVDVNNFKSENEQSFQDHAVSKENSFLKSGKKRKSIDSEKGKFQDSSSKRTSSSASSSSSLSSSSSKSLISDIHKSTSSKWESKFFDNDETSYYPVSKKCKSSYNEHEERKEGYRYKKRIDEKWKSKKKYSKHTEDFWQAHKSYRSGKKSKSRKYDHREMQNNYYNSSFNARNERHYSYEGNHYKEKFNSELQNSITHQAENTHQKANVKIKHKNGLDKSLLENSWDKKYLKQKKHLNYKSGDSDNSSCSYEMEWVEKTKETVEAEQKTSKSYNVPFKYWDSDVKDGFTQKTNDHNSNHNKYWNGRERNEIVKELQKYSSKGYGEGVNSWDGNRSHLEREVMEDSLQKRDHYDDYNEEYDRGKMKKIKKWHGNSKRMYSYNPFQKAWDSKKYEKYEHHSHRQNKHFHNRKFFNNHHHHWNYSKYSNATVRDKIQD